MSRRSNSLVDSVRQQILSALESGLWKAGARLPSTREMAAQLGVDPRTVTQAYRLLSAEGLVELRPRSGAYIASTGAAPRGAPAGLSEKWIVQILAESVRRETPANGLSEWIRRATETVRLRVFVIAPTIDQVDGLERELSVYYGLECAGAIASEITDGALPLGLRQADVVVTLGSTRALASAKASEAGIPVICVTVRADIVGPAWESLMQSPTYVIVRDKRFGHVIAEYLAAKPGGSDVRMLVAGSDDVGAIPEKAVVYVTQSARLLLGDTPINGSVLPQVQVISPESSTEILNFIVGANIGAVRARQDLPVER